MFLLFMPMPYHHAPCNINSNTTNGYAKLISDLIQTITVLSLLTSIGYLIAGAFKYLINQKKKTKNNQIKKTILRGFIGLGITFIIYYLISTIAVLNSCDLNYIGPPPSF